MKLSVLDLCPILSQHETSFSFRKSVELAQFVEDLGFNRYWLAEHHNMAGIGSSSPEVLISHIAASTKSIRVGSGGVMLPNHATLHMAEVFKTLEALYPNRIDFGIGRAPGSGSKAAQLLRGARGITAEDFPQEFLKLQEWLVNESVQGVEAIPQILSSPEVWILGSSDWGAFFAAQNGLPYSFAQHFSHLPAIEMMRLYKENFIPSNVLKAPHAMMACHIICAETDEEANELALSSDLSFSLFVQTGKSIPLPTVEEAKAYPYGPQEWKDIRAGSMPKFVGSPETIQKKLAPYIRSNSFEELMVLSMIHDQEKRKKSYELISKII